MCVSLCVCVCEDEIMRNQINGWEYAKGKELWRFWRHAARVYEDKWMRCLAYKSTYGRNADFKTCWPYLNTDFYVFYALVRTFK